MAALRKFKRLGLGLVLLIGGLAIAGFLSLRSLERRVLFSGPGWEARISRYLQDQNKASQNLWFRSPHDRVPVPAEIVRAAEIVPDDLMRRFKSRDLASGVEKSKEPVPAGLAWMAKLSGFDYWPAGGEAPPWLLWSMVRRMEGERRGEISPAFLEVRELARLAGSTHRWADAMDMMLVLHSERDEYDRLAADKHAPSALNPFERETLERASRVIEVAGDFFDFRWQPTTLAAVFGDPAHRVGLCAAIEHGVDLQMRLRDFLETSYPERFRVLGQVLTQTQTNCRLEPQRRAWADRSGAPIASLRRERRLERVGGKTPPDFPTAKYEQWKRFARVPFLNRYLGLRLAELASPDPELARHY